MVWLSEKELNQAKQDLDQRTFRQEFEGTFENYAGAIYYNFHPIDSVVNKPLIIINLYILAWTLTSIQCHACVGQIEKDKIYIVDEIVIYGSNTDEMVQEIRDRYGYKICNNYIS